MALAAAGPEAGAGGPAGARSLADAGLALPSAERGAGRGPRPSPTEVRRPPPSPPCFRRRPRPPPPPPRARALNRLVLVAGGRPAAHAGTAAG